MPPRPSAIVRVKHIKTVRRRGRVYRYHAKTRERLPDDPQAAARRALEINAGLASPAAPGERPAARDPRTVAGLIAAYMAAPEFRQLKPASRATYAVYLERLRAAWGRLEAAGIERRHVLALRDRLAETPAAANYAVTATRLLMAFAVERGMRADNPAARLRRLRTGPGHAPWRADQTERLIGAPGVPADVRAAALIALHTGQRRADVLAMTWSDLDGPAPRWTGVRVVQAKTGARLWIPLHAALRAALADLWPGRRGPAIVADPADPTGRPLSKGKFEHRWRAALARAGLAGAGLAFHGLRYSATERLFEAGCDVKQVAAITGHASLAQLAKYGRGADQRRLASAAIARLERTERKTPRQKPENGPKTNTKSKA